MKIWMGMKMGVGRNGTNSERCIYTNLSEKKHEECVLKMGESESEI